MNDIIPPTGYRLCSREEAVQNHGKSLKYNVFDPEYQSFVVQFDCWISMYGYQHYGVNAITYYATLINP